MSRVRSRHLLRCTVSRLSRNGSGENSISIIDDLPLLPSRRQAMSMRNHHLTSSPRPPYSLQATFPSCSQLEPHVIRFRGILHGVYCLTNMSKQAPSIWTNLYSLRHCFPCTIAWPYSRSEHKIQLWLAELHCMAKGVAQATDSRCGCLLPSGHPSVQAAPV